MAPTLKRNNWMIFGYWVLEADKAVRVWSIVREFSVPEQVCRHLRENSTWWGSGSDGTEKGDLEMDKKLRKGINILWRDAYIYMSNPLSLNNKCDRVGRYVFSVALGGYIRKRWSQLGILKVKFQNTLKTTSINLSHLGKPRF